MKFSFFFSLIVISGFTLLTVTFLFSMFLVMLGKCCLWKLRAENDGVLDAIYNNEGASSDHDQSKDSIQSIYTVSSCQE